MNKVYKVKNPDKNMELSDLLDLKTVRKVAKNITPIIPVISFGYLFYLNPNKFFLWMSILSIIFLTFFININDYLHLIIHQKIKKLNTKNEYLIGKTTTDTLFNDPIYVLNAIISIIFALIAFFSLLLNNKDYITLILIALCIFAASYTGTKNIALWYIGYKYSHLIDKGKGK